MMVWAVCRWVRGVRCAQRCRPEAHRHRRCSWQPKQTVEHEVGLVRSQPVKLSRRGRPPAAMHGCSPRHAAKVASAFWNSRVRCRFSLPGVPFASNSVRTILTSRRAEVAPILSRTRGASASTLIASETVTLSPSAVVSGGSVEPIACKKPGPTSAAADFAPTGRAHPARPAPRARRRNATAGTAPDAAVKDPCRLLTN